MWSGKQREFYSFGLCVRHSPACATCLDDHECDILRGVSLFCFISRHDVNVLSFYDFAKTFVDAFCKKKKKKTRNVIKLQSNRRGISTTTCSTAYDRRAYIMPVSNIVRDLNYSEKFYCCDVYANAVLLVIYARVHENRKSNGTPRPPKTTATTMITVSHSGMMTTFVQFGVCINYATKESSIIL